MPTTNDSCQGCRHFEDDPHHLERLLPGILILSSTYGSSRGDSGVCSIRDTFQVPEEACEDFAPRTGREHS